MVLDAAEYFGEEISPILGRVIWALNRDDREIGKRERKIEKIKTSMGEVIIVKKLMNELFSNKKLD
jgi:hypothetical protein